MRLLFLLILFLFSSSTVHANEVDTDAWIKFYDVANVSVKSEKTIFSWSKVEVYSSSKSESDLIMKYVEESMIAARAYFSSSSVKRCDSKELRVFFIKDKTLNDQNLMTFLAWDQWARLDINGAYEGIYSPGRTGSIFLSKTPSGKSVRKLVAHEIAHYWQDQHCGLRNSEITAREFEEHFVKLR